MLKRALGLRLFICVAAGLGALLPIASVSAQTSLPAASGDNFNLSYEIYAGGVLALSLDSKADVRGTDYTISATAHANGVLNFILRFAMQAVTSGRILPDRNQPDLYHDETELRWSHRSIDMVWDQAGNPTATTVPPPQDDDRAPVPADMLVGATDLMSAMLRRATSSDPCTGSDHIFDGRRRFDLNYEPAGEAVLAANQYSAYAGPAMVCKIKMVRLAGAQRNTDAEDRKYDNEPIVIWLTPLKRSDGSRTYYIPVRLNAANRWGDIVGHVIRADVDGETRLRMTGN